MRANSLFFHNALIELGKPDLVGIEPHASSSPQPRRLPFQECGLTGTFLQRPDQPTKKPDLERQRCSLARPPIKPSGARRFPLQECGLIEPPPPENPSETLGNLRAPTVACGLEGSLASRFDVQATTPAWLATRDAKRPSNPQKTVGQMGHFRGG